MDNPTMYPLYNRRLVGCVALPTPDPADPDTRELIAEEERAEDEGMPPLPDSSTTV